MSHALVYLRGMLDSSLVALPTFRSGAQMLEVFMTSVLVFFLVISEWLARNQQHALAGLPMIFPRLVRWLIYAFIVLVIGLYMQTDETPFIYFQL
jgi:hypothetical protein